MKKSIFFILVIILIIITFYNYYYEKFSVKVQDAMIFKDYKDNIVGTYPDRNIYPDIFVKAKGKYVNMIGTVHGVSEIKMSKPKDGPKGPNGDRGPQGKRGEEGPRGKHGRELIQEDIVNNRNSTCIAPGGISVSRMCKGVDGISPQKPPDGTPGEMCPHPGGYTSIEDGVEIYYGGKCPDGDKGEDGLTCMELIGSHNCPPGQPGAPGRTCAQVNSGLTITNNKCPDGDKGPDGYTCYQRFGHVNGLCPIPADGNPGQTCYQRFGPSTPGGLPNCSPSQPGVNSVDCMDPNNPNVKYCGRINPNKVHENANNLTINKFNGNELSIDNNTAIQLNGNINLPDNGKIILKNQNGSVLKEINKQYIDNIILKSKQCKKCPGDTPGSTRTHWNNSNNCENDQGNCIKCSECQNGYRTSTPCGQHNDAVFVECSAGYVGKECHTKCDPTKGEYPNTNKTGCNTISSSQYITNDYQIHNVPDGYYRNPNDATSIIICPKGYYCEDGVKNECPDGQFQSSTGKSECEDCPGNSIGDKTTCTACGNGQQPNTNKTACLNCPAGTAGTGGYCNLSCTRNKYSLAGATSCSSCGGGYKVNSSRTGCDRCPSGYYGNNGISCHRCPGDTNSARTKCRRCSSWTCTRMDAIEKSCSWSDVGSKIEECNWV